MTGTSVPCRANLMIMFYNSDISEKAKLDNEPHYGFCCSTCIFKECWSPGIRTTESITAIGPKLYGNRTIIDEHEVYICTWMFDYGCPKDTQNFEALARERIDRGWRSSPI